MPGSNPNPQAATVQYGPDLRNAVVGASNVRFEDGAGYAAPGYEEIEVDMPDETPVLIVESQQAGVSIVGKGKFLFVCTDSAIYLVSPV